MAKRAAKKRASKSKQSAPRRKAKKTRKPASQRRAKKGAKKSPAQRKSAAKSRAKAAKKRPAKKKTVKKSKKKTAAKRRPKKKQVKKKTVTRKAGKKKTAKKKTAKKKTAKKKAAKKKTAKKKAAKKKAVKKKVAKKKTAKKKVAKKKSVKKKAVKKKVVAAPKKKAPAKRRHIPDISKPTGMYGGVVLCQDPKPFPRKSPYSRQELASLKAALSAERERLRHELATMENITMGTDGEGGKESPGFPTHIAEYAAQLQATETILGVRSLEEERLEQVGEALQRLRGKKRYGLCLACGSKIGIERLIAKPHAHLCMDCRRQFERRRESG